MFFGVSRSVTECFQSVMDCLQPVTERGTPKNMAADLPGMTLQPLYCMQDTSYCMQAKSFCMQTSTCTAAAESEYGGDDWILYVFDVRD